MDRLSQAEANITRIWRELNDVQAGLAQTQPASLGSSNISLQPIPTTTLPSAANSVRNGELNHSVNTWNESSPAPTADKGKECAWWFTHDAPATGQVLDVTTDARASSTNHTLKAYLNDGGVHSTYNGLYCDWDRQLGQARLTGTKTLDAPLPNNRIAAPNRAGVYFAALVALRSSQIRFQDDTHIFAGIWDEAAKDWLRGTAFTVSGTVRGTPSGTVERRYRVRAFTDRGYEYISTELAIANAPASFSTSDVQLTWRVIPGILRYEVYRFDPSTATYYLLADDVIGGTYIDNGRTLKSVAGYPSATDTVPKAYVATTAMNPSDIPVDGLPWTPLRLNIPIPNDYDTLLTTANQVLRVGSTKPMDRELLDGLVSGTSLSSASGFTALDDRRTVRVFNDSHEMTPTQITYTSPTTATLDTAWPFGADTVSIYIYEGGDHGLLLDAAHLSYVPNSAFAPYPDDLNRAQNGGQNPIAAPNHSSQGGSGQTGSIDPDPGGGDIGCIALDCPVTVWTGRWEAWAWRAVNIGDAVFSGDLISNRVLRKHLTKTTDLHVLRVRAHWLFDIELPCSPDHPVITGRFDSRGRRAHGLKAGDEVLVGINGNVKTRKVRAVVSTGKPADVGTFSLTPHSLYAAGQIKFRTPLHEFIAKMLGKRFVAGVLSHNRKNREGDIT